jgi:Spy/CpxP family protein refolding chaperone
MRFSLMLASLAVAGFCIAPVFAEEGQPCPHQKEMGDGKPCPHMKGEGKGWAEELNLTADQKEKLKALREEMKPARKEMMGDMKSIREKAKTELLKSNPNKGALADLARQTGDAHKKMADKEQEHLLKVKAVLKPEQFEKILTREFMQDMMQKKMMQRKDGGCDHHEDGDENK